MRIIELTCTKGDYSSGAYMNYVIKLQTDMFASDIRSVCGAPGAITFKGASRCGIYDCYIHGVGVHGIEILGGCEHISIENNRV